jgi:hypothetical protein
MFQFSPPTLEEGPMGGHWLFYRYKLTRGISVLKINGEYYDIRTPSQDEINSASVVYQGGHVYTISSGEAAELTAAGYTVVSL